MRKMGLTPRVIVLVIVADVIQFIIMVSVKRLSEALPPISAGNPATALYAVAAALQSPFLWIAMTGMIASFIIWPAVLAALDLSVAFPLGSLSFVLIPLLSILFLGEEISALSWAGILIVTGGVAWLSMTERKPKVMEGS